MGTNNSTDITDSTALSDAIAAGEDTKREQVEGLCKPKPRPVGSKRGVETMFHNAYRAELEIITLVATKANIMISLNGFVASALMILGAFIYIYSQLWSWSGETDAQPEPVALPEIANLNNLEAIDSVVFNGEDRLHR